MFNKRKISEFNSINPHNKQGKYILDMMKRNSRIKDPLFQIYMEKKLKEKKTLNLSGLSKFSQKYYNETELQEKICIYI
jgi:hypothetical protein